MTLTNFKGFNKFLGQFASIIFELKYLTILFVNPASKTINIIIDFVKIIYLKKLINYRKQLTSKSKKHY